MVKLKGPLMSLTASGSMGKLLTFNKGHMQTVLRTRPVPTGATAALQTATRAFIRFCSQLWSTIAPADQGSWPAADPDPDVSPYNKYIAWNAARLAREQNPSVRFPPGPPISAPTLVLFTQTCSVRQVTIRIQPAASYPIGAGVKILRREIAVPFYDNRFLVDVVPFQGAAAFDWIDTPLPVALWSYRLFTFRGDGSNNRLVYGPTNCWVKYS